MTQQNTTGVHGGNGIKPDNGNGGVHGGNGIKPDADNGGVHGGNGIKPTSGNFGEHNATSQKQLSDKPVITLNIGNISLSVFATA